MTSATVQRTVGRYEILAELGRGATAIVHLARQVDLDRAVALKELAALRAGEPSLAERFLRESRLAGALTHPNVVTVYEYFEHDGTPFIAMEYLERGSLRPLVGHVSLAQAGGVLDGLLAGLGHAHGRGVVHRDLKPENVLVTAAGGVKIGDFGIAKALGSDSLLTTGGVTIGTPAYMAPEQALAGDVGPAADLYATGIVAYELLAGRVPFDGSDVPMAVMLQHLNAPVPPLRKARRDLDDAVCEWVESMLAKDPGDRPSSAAEAAETLDEVLLESLGPRWRRASRLDATDERSTVADESATARTKRARGVELRAPSGARLRSRRAGLIALAASVAVALALGGLALAAFVADDGGNHAADEPGTASVARGTTDLTTTPPPPATVLQGIRFRTDDDGANATLRLRGDPLPASSMHLRDDELEDGHAWLVLRQKGLATALRRVSAGALAAWVRTARGLVRIDLSAEPGAYDRVRLSRPNGHTVVVSMAKAPPPPTGSTGGSTGSAGPTGGSTGSTGGTTTTPPPPPTTGKKEPPPWGTG